MTSTADTTLFVSEIFYSVQGEGLRSGHPSIFIRLQGCKAKHACYAAGIRCDTDFESGKAMTLQELYQAIEQHPCEWIVWTGGEPLDQLTDAHLLFFAGLGYKQAVETSGLHDAAKLAFDFITVSPKVAEHVMAKVWSKRADGTNCDELRYVRHAGQALPVPSLVAHHYFISPHFDGYTANPSNLAHCTMMVLDAGGKWKLSVQMHKLIGVL
jgi:7-carboxy-7-deazaguanine synthase